MAVVDDLMSNVDTVLSTPWKRRKGQVVPETEDVALRDGAVDLEAAVLYADLASSTQLARKLPRTTSARIVRAYLSTMSRLVTHHGGAIRSFDGDRVMGVFVGKSKHSSAAKCALRMNWAVTKVLRPKVEAKFASVKEHGYVLAHCVGIHRSEVLVVRGGIRNNSDLVFVGSAPNLAAKLSEIRNSPYHSYITWQVHDNLNEGARISGKAGESYWQRRRFKLAGEDWTCYRSSWWWSP